jgi:hypothetical protein
MELSPEKNDGNFASCAVREMMQFPVIFWGDTPSPKKKNEFNPKINH